MADAKRDENSIPTLTGISNVDGETIVLVKVNPDSHILQVSDGGGGSDLSGDIAKRDNNMVPVAMGVSSVDGITPVPIYMNASGELLIDNGVNSFLLKEDGANILLETGDLIVI